MSAGSWIRSPRSFVRFGSWPEVVKPWRGGHGFIPAVIRPEMEDAVQRALLAGARPPLDYIGAGMTGIVFCDASSPPVAFKVARGRQTIFLEEEAEWLRDAGRIPGVREHVAHFIRYDREQVVLVRECVQQKEDTGRGRNERKLHELWRRIGAVMELYGWGSPEYKADSFVMTRGGPILVDASMPNRLGRRMVEYVLDVLKGKRALPGDPKFGTEAQRWRDLAFYVRREVTQGAIPKELGNKIIRKVVDREPSAAEWLKE